MPERPPTGETTYRRSREVLSLETGGQLLVVPVRGGACDLACAVVLDGTARQLWESLDLELDGSGAAAVLARSGDVPAEQARRDAEAFLRDLAARGLCEVLAPAADADGRDAPAVAAAPPDAVGLDPVRLVALARAVLAAGHTLRFRARGASMRPQIPDDSMLEVEARALADVRVGDVVLYAPGGDRLVAHRVLGRDAEGLVTRGDSASRRDRVAACEFLGVVGARIAGGRRVALAGAARWPGLFTNLCHRVRSRLAQWLFVVPLRRVPGLRVALRATVASASGALRRIENRSFRLRRRLDVARAALLSTAEKDRARERLYARTSVRSFTALDENVEAGLTLIEEVLLFRHPPAPGGRVLVLGCGPGRECAALALRGFDVTGLDRDAGMLEQARALADRRGLDIRFVRGRAEDFDLGEAGFETIAVFSGLYNMLLPGARRQAMLEAARRHLAPGGRVLVTFLSDYVPPGSGPPPRAASVWTRINPDHEEGDLFLINEAVHVFPHASRLRAEARAAGFAVEHLFRDQRAYDRASRQVRGYAVLAAVP